MSFSQETPSKSQVGSSHHGTFDRPFGWERQSRSVAVGKSGMAATSQPLATAEAIDVLKSGGSAVDAAIAANAVLCVTEPMSCGLGGDLFAIVWDAETETLHGLNASGRSPSALTMSEFKRRELTEIPLAGPLPWSVPGCVSGWSALHKKFGDKPFDELLQPAITAANDGFVVTPIIAGYWKSAEPVLRERSGSSSVFLVDGERSPLTGELFRNPAMGETLGKIASGGANEFYQGSIAEELVRYSEQQGGFLSAKDLAEHKADWVEPVSVDYRGYRVWELPPNGQGIGALQMLNVLGGYNLRQYGPGHPEYLHRLVEAKKLAFADRAQFYSDPSMVDVPIKELISSKYANSQRDRIDPDRAATDVPYGDPKLIHGDTIYLTVVDKDRNCCSLIQSTYYGFGSKMVPPKLGFAIQNRGALFALRDDHPNRYEPKKRPFHTIIPAMVTKDDRPVLSFGVMGGDMQPQGHVQVLVNWIDFGMNIQAAGDTARVRHIGSATPTGMSGDEQGGTVLVESGISDEAIKLLKRKGHQVEPSKSGLGGYQAILIDWKNGTLQGATETRKDGVAIGY
ncbi:MAG: gamma-glutamyltransferase [Planctomycetota bacterium]